MNTNLGLFCAKKTAVAEKLTKDETFILGNEKNRKSCWDITSIKSTYVEYGSNLEPQRKCQENARKEQCEQHTFKIRKNTIEVTK